MKHYFYNRTKFRSSLYINSLTEISSRIVRPSLSYVAHGLLMLQYVLWNHSLNILIFRYLVWGFFFLMGSKIWNVRFKSYRHHNIVYLFILFFLLFFVTDISPEYIRVIKWTINTRYYLKNSGSCLRYLEQGNHTLNSSKSTKRYVWTL